MRMNRRQYLARAGVSLGAVSLAGCLESLGGDDGDDVDVTDRTGERELDRAVGQLNDAALALRDAGNLEDPEDDAFDAAEPRDHLEQSDEHLSTAESELDGREDDLDELRTYAAVLETLIDTTAVVADETLTEDVDAVTAALEGDGDLESAQETIDERTATLEEAESAYDEATSELMALDADRLSGLSVIDLEEVESGAVQLGDVLSAQSALASGYDDVLAGYEHLERGQERSDDGDYEGAETAFTDAESAFGTASETFDGGKGDAPASLRSHFETALCQSGQLEDAAANFAESSAAAADRDPGTAQSRKNDAEDALEEARACGN